MLDPNPAQMSSSTNNPIDVAIRLSLIAFLAVWSWLIFKPFLIPVLWGIIIAVAIFPLYKKYEGLFGESKKFAIVSFTLIALSLLIVPSAMLFSSMVDSVKALADSLQAGTLDVPPPPSKVADWPLVGGSLFSLWTAASENLAATISQYKEEVTTAIKWLLSATAGTAGGILQFVISIIIASVFISSAKSQQKFSQDLFIRIAGETGKDFAEIAGATMRSVAQGVLGVALIQAVLAGIGFMVMGIPAAGLWTLGVMLIAIIQLPTIILLGPIIVYVFSVADTGPAMMFMVWSLLVGLSDNVLKPLLLGRGLDIPMLIILSGAIGGMMLHGIIGLFVGSVVLAIVYKLFVKWLEDAE